MTNGKAPLAIRALVGMMIGQLFDTVVFLTIAFYGSFPLMSALAGQYLVKVLVASLGAPMVPIIVALGRRYMHAETID